MEEYLKTLVNFYPVSSNQQHVLKLLHYIESCFKSHDLQSKMLTYDGIHNLYASTRGGKKCKLLLQAHIDVVPADDQPFKTSDNKFYGRGVYDMLFATACYLQLCDDLIDQLPMLDIAFMFSGDEELGGFNGVKPFLEAGYTTDVCILPDAGNNFGGMNIAAKGIATHSIRIYGQSHHGSRPWEGDGAAAKLVHFLTETEKIFDTSDRSNSTMTIAMINAGHADNQGPAFADATLDIRYKDKTDLERIKLSLQELLKKYNGEVIDLVEGDDYQLDLDNKYVQSFLNLYQKHHGKEIELTKAFGSSDARFFNAKGIPVIMLRPDGHGAHGDNEWISKQSMEQFYQLLKEYVIKTATIGEYYE